MSKRQKIWARAARARLIAALGGRCAACGLDTCLEFDCRSPKGDKHHRMDTSSRMSFYNEQHKTGNLQLLCERCHNRKTAEEGR